MAIMKLLTNGNHDNYCITGDQSTMMFGAWLMVEALRARNFMPIGI